ncbi:cytidine deaminase [Legionella hackeliae]|uniref:Cytidine deaminase n=1 Tax=Legionella hackeliae TaxID=449 RepID=A0A0A8UQ60_LEGHA|nr:cytidine deaminase [Legionella hackeliae]KTD09774.1 cytidine deaminase [Legionella hackeliae]CEK10898.1 Cytidine deaminase [Legionella hackeliae]STX47636.1 cytidine deaminase [Legionella hackeliae]
MVNIETSMINQATLALPHAYAPYSNFQVASCLCSEDGSFFTGVNVENAAYGLTICAESAAICHMIAAGQRKIKSIVVLNGENTLCPPCGACRQRILEFSQPDTVVHLCTNQRVIKTMKITELLPEAFRFKPNQD